MGGQPPLLLGPAGSAEPQLVRTKVTGDSPDWLNNMVVGVTDEYVIAVSGPDLGTSWIWPLAIDHVPDSVCLAENV